MKFARKDGGKICRRASARLAAASKARSENGVDTLLRRSILQESKQPRCILVEV
jgi:hypothetical protein